MLMEEKEVKQLKRASPPKRGWWGCRCGGPRGKMQACKQVFSLGKKISTFLSCVNVVASHTLRNF